jgi:hypothetical protein
MVELDKWIEKVKRCEFLAEDELKSLCEYVSSCDHQSRAGLLVSGTAWMLMVSVCTRRSRKSWLRSQTCSQCRDLSQ